MKFIRVERDGRDLRPIFINAENIFAIQWREPLQRWYVIPSDGRDDDTDVSCIYLTDNELQRLLDQIDNFIEIDAYPF